MKSQSTGLAVRDRKMLRGKWRYRPMLLNRCAFHCSHFASLLPSSAMNISPASQRILSLKVLTLLIQTKRSAQLHQRPSPVGAVSCLPKIAMANILTFCSPPHFVHRSSVRPSLTTDFFGYRKVYVPSRNVFAERRARFFAMSFPSSPIPDEWDTVVIGSGPVGSTIARYLASGGTVIGPEGKPRDVKSNQRVLIVDAGQRLSPRAGDHVKNSLLYQMDHGEGQRLFAQFIASTIQPVSRDPSPASNRTALPNTWQPGVNNNPESPYANFSPNLTNPDQEPFFNLAGAAVSYKVGGMGTHWTCSTPRPHPTIEMNDLFPSDPLYSVGESLLRTDSDAYDNELRNVLVAEKLRTLEHLKFLNNTPFGPQDLPLAVQRRNDQFVEWTGSSALLGDLSTRSDENFMIAEQLVCKRLVVTGGKVTSAVLTDPRGLYTPDGAPGDIRIKAKNFVVACGQVASAQLLAASGFDDLTANGKYLTEQPFMFTRIVLDRKLVEQLFDLRQGNPLFRFKEVIEQWRKDHPNDPIPIPRNGRASGEVQQWIPVSEKRPWHVQIHNDNFLDYMGLPQPTFDYTFTRGDVRLVDRAYEDLLKTMVELGAPVPGSNTDPQFLENGSALHIHGANRIGRSKSDSVANPNGRVWDRENLWVAGNSTIPKGIAVNPTLTSVCLAVRTCMDILGLDTSGTFAPSDRDYVVLNEPKC
eukprot:IDg23723t1